MKNELNKKFNKKKEIQYLKQTNRTTNDYK